MRRVLPALERARWTPVSLPLRCALPTAHASIRERRGFVLELVARDGSVGVADCLPLSGFGLESPDAAGEAVLRGLLALSPAPGSLDEALDRLEEALPGRSAARACLDVALHDLAARAAGVALAGLFGAARRRVPVSALLSAQQPEAAAREAKQRVCQGFRTLKLKLGVATLGDDLARAAAVRAAVGAAVRLRFDANAAWGEAEARDALRRLAGLEPEFVEEPLADATAEALARLRRDVGVRLAADESLRGVDSARELLARRSVDALVLKPAAVGGLREARHIAEQASRAGVARVVTSFLDAAPGLAAALHLAAGLRGAMPAAGLATDALLARDLAALPPIRQGARALPGPGLGVVLEASRVDALRTGPTRELRFS